MIEPAFKKYNITQKSFKALAYTILIILFIIIVIFLPKGDCTVTSKIDEQVKIDTTKLVTPLVIHDTVVKHDTIIDEIKPIKNYHAKNKLVSNKKDLDSNKNKAPVKYQLNNPSFNAPTQVGDKNIQNNTFNSEHTLTDEDKNGLIRQIELTKQKFNLTNNCIHLCITMGSNGQKIMKQIENFLPTKGYEITNHALIPGSFDNIKYEQEDGCVAVELGIF